MGAQGPRRSAARGELEAEVLAALATADEPMTVAGVQSALSRRLAYTTVMTTLARLHAKGAVQRTRQGRAWAYAAPGGAASARANVAAHGMLKLLDAEHDRSAILARFVADLSPSDERLLRDLLERPDEEPG